MNRGSNLGRPTGNAEQAIRHYLDVTNAEPKPFVWTKTADEILEKLAGYCVRISNSGQ